MHLYALYGDTGSRSLLCFFFSVGNGSTMHPQGSWPFPTRWHDVCMLQIKMFQALLDKWEDSDLVSGYISPETLYDLFDENISSKGKLEHNVICPPSSDLCILILRFRCSLGAFYMFLWWSRCIVGDVTLQWWCGPELYAGWGHKPNSHLQPLSWMWDVPLTTRILPQSWNPPNAV